MQDIANTEQAAAWNGYEGTHWAEHQDRWNAVNEGFDEPLLTAAAIGGRDRVLDLGCGGGHTSRLAAARAAEGRVLGLDLSGPMLAYARAAARQEGLDHLTFEQGDAQVHPLEPGGFDVAISRYGVMFYADPVAAFRNIGRALRPGGRIAFVAAADAARNQWLQALAAVQDALPIGDFGRPDAPGMFSLANPERTRELFAAAGFEDIDINRVEAPGTWGRDAEDAADFLLDSGPGRHLASLAGQDAADRARRSLADVLRPYARDGAVRLRSSSWLITARRPRASSAESAEATEATEAADPGQLA